MNIQTWMQKNDKKKRREKQYKIFFHFQLSLSKYKYVLKNERKKIVFELIF